MTRARRNAPRHEPASTPTRSRLTRLVGSGAGAAVLGALLTVQAVPPAAAATYNYAEALQKSIFFYEAQQSGRLPDWNRVEWRGDATLGDGKSVGVDLSGGWYDAGDHVKFGFPMAFTTTMLAWGLVENREAYARTGQLTAMVNNLTWATDYLIKAHPSANTLYVQVGDGSVDHAYWGPPEALDVIGMSRPVFKIDASHPGTDVAAETAAAMAASAVALREDDPAYAQTLLTHAKQLFTFADTTKGSTGQDTAYVKSVPEAQAYYNSVWEGTNANPGATKMYWDELAWASVWLYRATDDAGYLDQAREFYPKMGTEQPPGGGTATVPAYSFGLGWNDKQYGVYVLMAALTGEQQFRDDAQRWLDYWTVGYQGKKGTYTPGGLAYIFYWGSLRMAAHTAWAALVYADYLGSSDPLYARYHDFAKRQIDYALGDNPGHHSYMVGFGTNPPTHVHHRAASGQYLGYMSDTTSPNLHTIYGALAGGPDQNDAWADDRNDYQKNEVALDYNAGLTSALARLAGEYGGTPLAGFPGPAQRTREEIYASTVTYNSDPSRLSTNVVITNTSAWPPRVLDSGTARYYFTLDGSVTADQIRVSGGGSNGCAVTGPHPYSGNTYYAEIDCTGKPIYPGDAQLYKRQTALDIAGPSGTTWDRSNDWSASSDSHIPVYDDGALVWGSEPGGTTTTTTTRPTTTTTRPTTTTTTRPTTTTTTTTRPTTTRPTTTTTTTTRPTTTTTTTRPTTTTTRPTTTTTTTTTAGGACTAAYTVAGQWPGGFQGEVTVTAGTRAINGWRVTWTFADGQTINQAWNATVTSTGSTVTAGDVGWNGWLTAGGTATFGFIAAWNGSNSVPTLTCTSG